MEFYDGDVREHHHMQDELQKNAYFKNYNDWLTQTYKKSENNKNEIQKFETESKYTLSGLLVCLWTPFVTFSIIVSIIICICMFLLWLIGS